MKPIAFNCTETIPLPPEDIAAQILDVAKWPDFRGYGPIPGIKSAEFETRTPNVVGSRIRVLNLYGSTHVEEIVEWQPSRLLVKNPNIVVGNYSYYDDPEGPEQFESKWAGIRPRSSSSGSPMRS